MTNRFDTQLNRVVSALVMMGDYSGRLPQPGDTQKFYRNFAFQLGQMGYPVIIGHNRINNIGYFLHRIQRVPVALLQHNHPEIVERFCAIKKLSPDILQNQIAPFLYTASVHNEMPADMVSPADAEKLATLQAIFDAATPAERRSEQGKYIVTLKKLFQLQ